MRGETVDWNESPSKELTEAAVRAGVTEPTGSSGDLARAIIRARRDSMKPSDDAVDLAIYLSVNFDPSTIKRRELYERTQGASVRVSRQLVQERVIREGIELEYLGGDFIIGRVDRVRFNVHLTPRTPGWEPAVLSVVIVHKILQEQQAAAERGDDG